MSNALRAMDQNTIHDDDLLIALGSSSDGTIPLDELSPLTSLNSSPCSTPTSQTPPLPTEAVIQGATNRFKRKNARNKKQSKSNKKRKKNAARALEFAIPAANVSSCEKYASSSQPICTSNRINEGLTTQNGYTGKKTPFESEEVYSLKDLVGERSSYKFQLEKWDSRTAKPLLDASGAMYGLLAGRPGLDESDWRQNVEDAATLMEKARQWSTFGSDSHQRPRGSFPVLTCGVSHGGGQPRPCNVSHANTKRNRKVLNILNRTPCFRRIANFASSVFASWAPKLYQKYVDTAKALHGRYPDLERPFPQSAFSAATYNLGPQTICCPHADVANLPYGWCAIVALGNYDLSKGGHLVLWECKLVVEFPPGSLVLIPSAVITHSNTMISLHETHYSFTQYSAGGLFRWVDQEFKSQVEYRVSKSTVELAEIDEKLLLKWEEGLALLPRITQSFSP